MGDPASKKECGGGARKVGGRKRHGRGAHKIAYVINGHDHDDRAAQRVDRLDPFLSGCIRGGRDRGDGCGNSRVGHWISRKLLALRGSKPIGDEIQSNLSLLKITGNNGVSMTTLSALSKTTWRDLGYRDGMSQSSGRIR